MKRALAALGLLLAFATPCFAGDPEKDKQFVGLCIGCLTVVPLALFPVGLAFHLLLRALAPRRARFLIDAAESGRVRTFLLGFLNAIVLTLVGYASQVLHAPVVGLLAFLAITFLMGLGSYGLAGSLGSRITGSSTVDLKELALGWFVLVYVGCFPLVGWVLALYGAYRAIGIALFGLLAADEPGPTP